MVGKFSVLVVDDDPDKRQLIAVALQMEGYEIYTAQNGQEGLDVLAKKQPDLIVTDVMMPVMDGYEMARQVRENPRTRFIPIIIQTAARNAAQDHLLGAEAGALGYLTDPTDLDLLLARARTLLDFKNYLDTLEEAAFTDHLTGLANRRRFERQLEREVARATRHDHPFCLLLIDIDNFKRVNDEFGHIKGDEAIRRLASALQAETRGMDMSARVGGEEFGVILPETKLARGMDVSERLRAAIKAMKIPEIGEITASFGVAEFPSDARNSEELFTVADAALYEAKNNGRDRVVCGRNNSLKQNSSRARGVS
ncbi:MAG: diguanylate cyclase [Pyrinomonadaceae bacterium]|nr:diguanylate cyclase [Pyrinomonadaceae bacterium]